MKIQQTKVKRAILIILCVIILVTIFLSVYDIIEHVHHDCTGEHCPLCEHLKISAAAIRALGTGFIALQIGVCISVIVLLFSLYFDSFAKSKDTPVRLRVRLNN